MSITAAEERGDASGAADFFMWGVGLPEFPTEAASVAQQLARLEPGVAAAAYLQSLRVDELDELERIEVLRAWERQHAWTSAHTQAAILAVAGPQADEVVDDADDFAREELALALQISPRSAGKRLHTARMLAQCLPATSAALARGAISPTHVQIMVDECTGLPEATVREVEARVIGRAAEQSPGRFGAAVRRAVIAAAPVSAELAHAVAKTERGVWLTGEPDGMATLSAFLPAAEALAAYNVIDTAARAIDAVAEGGQKLGIAERRADALIALLVRSGPAGARATGTLTAHSRPTVGVELQVVIDAATLLGVADNPAELVGYGPITAGLARELGSDATWRRLVTDPATGYLLDYGRRAYRPPEPLRRYLQARDRNCRLPGCRQPATHGDVDHTHPWSQGGNTSAANCAYLCRRHHRMKTHAGWRVELHEDGSATWTTAAGRRYDCPPPAQLEPPLPAQADSS